MSYRKAILHFKITDKKGYGYESGMTGARATENGTQVPTVFRNITALAPPTEKRHTMSDILILEDPMILMDPCAPCLPDRRIPGLLRA